MTRSLVVSGLLFALSSCAPAEPRCVSGLVSACPCPSGAPGTQTCTEGAFGPCECSDSDASIPHDAAVNHDASGGPDAGLLDDAGITSDARFEMDGELLDSGLIEDGGQASDAAMLDGCVPDCSGRSCGPDPRCGLSCGPCVDGVCEAGICRHTVSGGPQILQLRSNTTTLRPNGTLVITAVVTDPNGIDDVIGGTLLDPTTGSSYAAFATTATEGSYQVSLTWSAINTVAPIEAPRVFRAEFFDQAGNRGSGDLTISFACDSATLTPCAGRCVDLLTNHAHCGTCGNDLHRAPDGPVPNGRLWDSHCENGAPACDSGYLLCDRFCVDPGVEHCGGCNIGCTAPANACLCVDEECTARGCGFTTPFLRTRRSCEDVCDDTTGYRCASAEYEYEDPDGDVDNLFLEGCARVPPANYTDSDGFDYVFDNMQCTCVAGAAQSCVSGPESTVSRCTDGCSNDGDRYIDCEDRDCCGVVTCAPTTYCGRN